MCSAPALALLPAPRAPSPLVDPVEPLPALDELSMSKAVAVATAMAMALVFIMVLPMAPRGHCWMHSTAERVITWSLSCDGY